jgi:biliverdin reductase
MDNIGLGIVGSGGMAGSRATSFGQTEGFRLTAVAARNPETGPALAEAHGLQLETDWRRLVVRDDVDAVVITTHNELHGAITLAALEAGKHVFAEYPVAQFDEELDRLATVTRTSHLVLRAAHREAVSAVQQTLRRRAAELGPLMLASFHRLTPGRGARPEVLFNLNLSGPPALFFVYHVHPMVDLFGPADWVEAGATYVDLREDGGYQRFANTVTVGFQEGGIGQWTWAGGIEVGKAEDWQRIVMSAGTLMREGGPWRLSTRESEADLDTGGEETLTLEQQFLADIRGGGEGWRRDARTAIDAARIGVAAEQSVKECRRISLAGGD